MKAADIVLRLKEQLPRYTNAFTVAVDVLSLTPSGTTVTAVTDGDHGVVTGDSVLVVGARSPVAIASITRVGTVATVATTTDHDLTSGDPARPTVTIDGATEAEFNGTFPLLTVTNRRTFTIAVDDAGPTTATGAPLLVDPLSAFGYNGLATVTGTPTTDSFTYETAVAQPLPAQGTIKAVTDVRCTGAITQERTLDVFDKAGRDKAWAFVVLGDVAASRDRHSMSDGVSVAGNSGARRQQILQPFRVLVLQTVADDGTGAVNPRTTGTTSGMVPRDVMEDDIAPAIIKALVGFSPSTGFSTSCGEAIRFVSHGVLDYDGATYAHELAFELATNITDSDVGGDPIDVAFRDVEFTLTNSLGSQPIQGIIDLDDEPL